MAIPPVSRHFIRSSLGFRKQKMKAAALIIQSRRKIRIAHKMTSTVQRLFFFCRRPADEII